MSLGSVWRVVGWFTSYRTCCHNPSFVKGRKEREKGRQNNGKLESTCDRNRDKITTNRRKRSWCQRDIEEKMVVVFMPTSEPRLEDIHNHTQDPNLN